MKIDLKKEIVSHDANLQQRERYLRLDVLGRVLSYTGPADKSDQEILKIADDFYLCVQRYV